jgi:hypothetical protein
MKTFAVATSLFLGAISIAQGPPGVGTLTGEKGMGWDANGRYMVLEPRGPLAKIANETMLREETDRFNAFSKQAHADVQELPETAGRHYYRSKPQVSLLFPNLISLYSTIETFRGGAHPNQEFATTNFGMVAKKPTRLRLQHLFKPGVDAVQTVSPLVIEQLRATGRAAYVHDQQMKELTPEQAESFVITRSGLTFLFGPDVVGPHAAGSFQIKVPFTAMKDQIDPDGPLRPLFPRPRKKKATAPKVAPKNDRRNPVPAARPRGNVLPQRQTPNSKVPDRKSAPRVPSSGSRG